MDKIFSTVWLLSQTVCYIPVCNGVSENVMGSMDSDCIDMENTQ